MWVECPTELDTPVLIFGFEVEDIAALSAVMVFSGLFIFEGFIPVFFVTLAFGLGAEASQEGQGAGGADPPDAQVGHFAHSRRPAGAGRWVFTRDGRFR